MNTKKWIALGVLIPISILIKILLSNIGIQLNPTAELWLWLAISALFAVKIIVPIFISAEERKLFKWFYIFFFLLAFTSQCQFCKKAPKTQNRAQQPNSQQITASNSKITEVEVPGTNPDGDVFLVEKFGGPGCYDITHVEGTKIFDNLQQYLEKNAYDIWGADYDPSWKPYFPCAHIPGMQALETGIIADGEIGGPKQLYQFPDGERTVRVCAKQYIRIFWHGPLKPDINGDTSWCFRNNYGKWVFRIKKVED